MADGEGEREREREREGESNRNIWKGGGMKEGGWKGRGRVREGPRVSDDTQ